MSIPGLVDDEIVSIKDEIVSVKDETSADEAAAKLKQYVFISAVLMFYSRIKNLADDFEENPLAM